jgi:hypothetical protein
MDARSDPKCDPEGILLYVEGRIWVSDEADAPISMKRKSGKPLPNPPLNSFALQLFYLCPLFFTCYFFDTLFYHNMFT